MSAQRKAEVERLAALANVGAERAADAFAQLVGRPIRFEESILRDASGPNAGPGAPEDESTWSTGVFFELDGCVDALVGILFPGSASEVLVRRIVGIESGDLEPAMIESALMEVGNILASHVASGIADAMQSRLLPSIPTLAMESAEEAFAELIEHVIGQEDADVPRIESALVDEDGRMRGRLVLVPTRLDACPDEAPGSESAGV